MEAPLSEVHASLAPIPQDQDKSNALPVQREVPVSPTEPTCLAFAGRVRTEVKQIPYNPFLADIVQNERTRLILA